MAEVMVGAAGGAGDAADEGLATGLDDGAGAACDDVDPEELLPELLDDPEPLLSELDCSASEPCASSDSIGSVAVPPEPSAAACVVDAGAGSDPESSAGVHAVSARESAHTVTSAAAPRHNRAEEISLLFIRHALRSGSKRECTHSIGSPFSTLKFHYRPPHFHSAGQT